MLAERWAELMRQGEMEAAWRVCDRAVRERGGADVSHLPRHLQPVWDGRPVTGRRVLVRCYHGLGDTLQFIRYAPLLRSVAREVIVWAQPPLLRLVSTVEGVDRVLPLHDGAPDVEYDVDVEVMELPHVFRSTLETLPARVPYLHVPPADRRRDGRLAVGLVWRAGDWDDRRSIPPHLLSPLGDVDGVAVHALQRGPGRDELPAGLALPAGSDDPWEAAREMRALDLVVTVDSMPAHLAGAFGVPTWTLLHTDPDWRWMCGRDDSPWYPSMRLFRQPRPGDWLSVISRVVEELTALVASRRRDPVASARSCLAGG